MIRNGGFLDDNVRYAKNMMDLEQYQQQINKLQQELQRKDNNWNELKKELEDDGRFELFYADDTINSVMTLGAKYYREYLLDKMKELEGNKNEK